MDAPRAWSRRHELGRFELRPLAQPLLKQQSGSRTVQTSAAVTIQAMAFPCSPGTAVFVDPGQGKLQRRGQPQSVATAMLCLLRRSSGVIQGKTNHKPLNRTPLTVLLQQRRITAVIAAVQGR